MEQPYAELSTPRDTGPDISEERLPEDPAPADDEETLASVARAAIAEVTSKVWAAQTGPESEEKALSYQELADNDDEKQVPITTPSPVVSAVTNAAASGVAAMTELTSSAWGSRAAHVDEPLEQHYEELVTPRPAALEIHSSDDPGFVALADESGRRGGPHSDGAMLEMAQLCPAEDNARSLGSLYGRHIFWLGRILVVQIFGNSAIYIGPHWPCSLVMLGMIQGAGGFFLFNVAVELGVVHQCLSVLVTIASTIAFLRCALSDPGILRENHESGSTRPKCNVCRVVQERGSRHCEFCQVCISGYDHHCPWMSKCIGSQNLSAFYTFICVGIGSLIYMVIAVITSPMPVKG